jgi:hypothetical protein
MLLIVISPILRGVVDYPAYWVNRYFECDLTLTDVTVGFFVTGYFPIFPWLAYSLAGLVAGDWLLQVSRSSIGGEDDTLLQKKVALRMMSTGAALIVASGFLLATRSYYPAPISKRLLGGWTMFPPSTEYVLATIGLALILFGVMHQWIDGRQVSARMRGLMDIAKTFSRYSFTIYVLHHLVHLWPMWIYAVWNGQEPTYYWQNAMAIECSIPLAFVFLATCYFILRKLGPDRRWGIEGWMRWLCD